MSKNIKKILVVDDNEILVRSIERHLHRHGFNVGVAFDGEVAQEMVRRAEREGAPFEVILSDIVMPVMDGFDFVRWMHGTFPQRPIIIISGFGNQDKIQQLLRPECDFFHKKPVLPQDIIGSIQKINIRHLSMLLEDDVSCLETLFKINDFYIVK